jgi:hypothetical protein
MISLAITKLEHRFIRRMRLVVVVSGGYDLVKSRHADVRATRHCLLLYLADTTTTNRIICLALLNHKVRKFLLVPTLLYFSLSISMIRQFEPN